MQGIEHSGSMSFPRYREAIRMMYIGRGVTNLVTPRSHHPDEPPTGYSLASCSPALLASASPAKRNYESLLAAVATGLQLGSIYKNFLMRPLMFTYRLRNARAPTLSLLKREGPS